MLPLFLAVLVYLGKETAEVLAKSEQIVQAAAVAALVHQVPMLAQALMVAVGMVYLVLFPAVLLFTVVEVVVQVLMVYLGGMADLAVVALGEHIRPSLL
jgi:uncharacterized protein YacL